MYGHFYGFYAISPVYYIALFAVMIFAFVANSKVKSTFNKYHKIRSIRNITGAEAARQMLLNNGIHDVKVERIGGSLTDHYDPRSKTIRLSDPVYNNPSVASVSVACHEVGHAIQHAHGYVPLSIRTAILPVANIGSKAFWPLFFGGFILSIGPLMQVGIILYAFAVLFQLATLPVEFDASSRALKYLENEGVLYDEENTHSKKVLWAAAMTYVASAAMALVQLLRFVLLSRGRD